MSSRAPQGARGLKYIKPVRDRVLGFGRAPQGARGLKCSATRLMIPGPRSRPARGAWVEIPGEEIPAYPRPVAPRKGRVG